MMIDSATECAEIALRLLRRSEYEKRHDLKESMILDAKRWLGKAMYALSMEEDEDGKTETPNTGTTTVSSTVLCHVKERGSEEPGRGFYGSAGCECYSRNVCCIANTLLHGSD